MPRNQSWRLVPRPRGLDIVLATVTGLVLFGQGCMSVDHPAKKPVGNAAKQVKVDGTSVQLGEPQKPALTPDAFSQRINDLLTEQKYESAHRLVQRYPDVTLDILRGATCRQSASPNALAIAKIYDEQCCKVDSKSGWAALIKDRAEHTERYAAHDIARQKLVDCLRNNHSKEAQEITLLGTVKGAPGVALEVDALQLTGEAHLLGGRPKEAAATLAEACKLAKTAFPHQSIKLLLLLSDAQRRAGHDAEAAATWKDAIELAASLLNVQRPFADPALWERIAYLRPVSSPWPGDIAQQLNQRADSKGRLPTGPAVIQAVGLGSENEMTEDRIWALIGQWRLYRGEPQGALLAYKRAEGFSHDQLSPDRLQLGEALALAALGQRAAAMAILNHLAESKNPDLAQAAFAVLGSLLFHEGQATESRAMLQKAVGPAGAQDWPGRAEAEADLGLACLTAGAEAEGLEHLHNAQTRFEAAGEFELLQQCLWNEATYLDHSSKSAEANAVRQRGRSLETQFQLNPAKW